MYKVIDGIWGILLGEVMGHDLKHQINMREVNRLNNWEINQIFICLNGRSIVSLSRKFRIVYIGVENVCVALYDNNYSYS